MNLTDYLEACHLFSLALEVVTDETLTTYGDTTKPSGRPFPQRIVPWDDFPIQQEEVWEKLLISERFMSQRVFPSAAQLEYVRQYLDPVNSEFSLQYFARQTVENPVRTLVEEIYRDEQLQEQFQVYGAVMFEADDEKSEDADQFYICHMSDGQRVPVVSIEYKTPHKFPLAEIIAGLKGEIRPADELINKEGGDFEFLSKSLVAAVITQLFSAMIGKGVQLGYVFVGEAIIFLRIPDDPTMVYYHLSIPRLDFEEDDNNRFCRTSVAQVFAFVLNALAAKAPGQSWHDAAARLDTWAVEYIDIFKKIPEKVRKAPPQSLYNATRWKGLHRSPIRTTSQNLAAVCDTSKDNVRSDEDDESDRSRPPTPNPHRTTRQRESKAKEMEATSRPRIEDRPYCTQQCLLGLASGGAIDNQCPNLKDHQGKHLQLRSVLYLIRVQLARDRGRDADCKPLYVKGSRGALVKIRLSTHGYTLVAKAMKQVDRQHLLQEAKVYSKLRSMQGLYIPVCLGKVDLELPYYYDSGTYVSMLLLSWAGRPIFQYLNPENEGRMLDALTKALKALHKHQVLHTDAELRNWLWDEQRASLMLVDFERAKMQPRLPPSTIIPDRERNQLGQTDWAGKDNDFDREIRSARGCMSRCARMALKH